MHEPSRRLPARLGWTAAAATLAASAAVVTALLVETASGSPAASCRWRKAGPPRLSRVVSVESVAARSAKDVWLAGFAYRSSADDGMASWHWNGKRWVGVGVKGLTATVSPLFWWPRAAATPGRSVARHRELLPSTGTSAFGITSATPGGPGCACRVRLDGPGLNWSRSSPARHLGGRRWHRPALAGLLVAGRDARVREQLVGDRRHQDRGHERGLDHGYDQDLDQWRAARWTGADWSASTVATGLIHARPGLNIAAVSSSDAWIVGRSPQQKGRALVGHWDGTSWSAVVGLPLPPGVASELSGIVARTAHDVWAVGSYLSSGATRSLVLHWNGARWSRVAAPGTGLSEVAVVPGSSAGLGGRRQLSRQTARARQRPSLPLLSLRAAAVTHSAAAPKSSDPGSGDAQSSVEHRRSPRDSRRPRSLEDVDDQQDDQHDQEQGAKSDVHVHLPSGR